MSELLSDIDAPSDAELISRVRGGDVAAYGELFSRHVEAANRLGRQLARGPDVDDLVSEAFAKVLQVLQGGGGPDVAFRAYLLTSVRRLHVDRIRAGAKLQTSDDMSQFDPGIPFQDTAVADFEHGAAAKAFASLPERWQLVLWHLEVEEQKPAEIAPLLGMSANSVSALAYRAREGLRQAFLTMHLADTSSEECRWVNEHLGGYVRKGLSRRDTAKVEGHLDECRRCTAMYLELTDVNSNLAAIIAPLLLGAAATGYLASTGAAGATGLLAVVGRLRDTVAGNAGAATAGAVAAGVAAVATAGFLITTGGHDPVVTADPVTSTSPASPNAAVPPELPATKSPGTTPARPAHTPATPNAFFPAVDLISSAPSSLPGATTQPGTATVADATQPGDTATTPVDGSPAGPGTATSGPPSDPAARPTDPPTSPTTSPSRPTADLRLGTVSFDASGTTLVIPVTNLPAGPTTVRVELASSETTFSTVTSPECVVTADAARRAVCAPSLDALGAGMVSARMDAPSRYTIRLPLDFPASMDHDNLTIKVSAIGHDETDSDDNTYGPFLFVPPAGSGLVEHDFKFSGVHQTGFTLGADGKDAFRVVGRVGAVPEGVEKLTFTLTSDAGEASFGMATGDQGAECLYVSDDTVECTSPAKQLDVGFTVFLPTGTSDRISIRLDTPSDYTDPVLSNDSSSTRLVPAKFDFAVSDLRENLDNSDTTYDLTSTVSAPPVAGDMLFNLTLPPDVVLSNIGPASCSAQVSTAAATQILCEEVTGTFDLTFTVTLPNTEAQELSLSLESFTGDYLDPDQSNNTAPSLTLDPDEVPVSALKFDSHLGVEVDHGNNAFTIGTALTGLPEGPASIEFEFTSESGDTNLVSAPADCEQTDNRFSCDIAAGQETLPLSFDVRLPGKKVDTVTLTASFGADTTSTVLTIDNTTPGGSSASN
ncbi:MAG TPA: sigma-70 family RNA polymerase sigma factor [Nocardioidaceae bacterium]|nr:sigma-70 family RNA polymerase sigma factor [Nocardioidaceae bacterium]